LYKISGPVNKHLGGKRDASVWWGFLGPAAMAPDLVPKIHTDLAATLKYPVVLTALEKMGATPVGSSSRDFDAYMRAEAKKWEPVLKEANIRMQRGHRAGVARSAHRAFAGACTCHRSARQCRMTASISARPATA
jgi:hypothetical protein